MATEKVRPFDQLTPEQQKAAVDIGVTVAVLGTRIPTAGKELYDLVCEHFMKSYTLGNEGKYALRELGKELFASNWELTVTKRGARLVTQFEKLQGDNGEIKITQ